MRVFRSSGARAERSAAICRLTAITAVARDRPSRLVARFARMYGIIVKSRRPEDTRTRTNAHGHVLNRALGTELTPLRRANQIGPIADRPVVANRDHHRHVRLPCRANRWQRGHHVLCVDDVEALCGDQAREVLPENPRQPLALEVIPHVRQIGRGEPDFLHDEAVVIRLLEYQRARREPGGRRRPRDRGREDRVKARTCSSRCRRTSAGTSRWQ